MKIRIVQRSFGMAVILIAFVLVVTFGWCALLDPVAAQNVNRGQKVPPRTPQQPEKQAGVEKNEAAKIIEAEKTKERIDKMAQNIHNELDGHVVGYSFVVGDATYQKPGSYGQARTSADGGQQAFMPTTKVTVASVSKMVTAIAAVRILSKNGVSIDAAIGPYLPTDWSVSNYVKNIKFSQLLSHTSGIKDYGNQPPNDYAALKSFFTQPVNRRSTTVCQPASVVQPANPINPNDLTPCYSNYNFAIFRVLLPKVAGFASDSNPATRPQTLADQYTRLVQQNLFDLVGQRGVACKPPAMSPHAFAYNYPGTKAGYDWGDVSLICGAAGWYLSAEDMGRVLTSISSKDGRILSATAANDETMRAKKLGWDIDTNSELEKNGGWSAGCDSHGAHCGNISTTVIVFDPDTAAQIIGVLFLNSDISGGPSRGGSAESVLEKAHKNALTAVP